jgi:hypothetical protein
MKSAEILTYLNRFLTDTERSWLTSKMESNAKELALAFVLSSRKIEKKELSTLELWKSFDRLWNLDKLSKEAIVRAYLLSHLSEKATDVEYQKWMDHLFETAEINESVALIQFLLVSTQPESLLNRAKDAVRSNVGNIFDAIAFYNPYAYHYFEEAAWNQLILKCIFNDKPIHLIVGLDERRNAKLAETLSDFAHERWAAGRRVPSQVWRLVSPFVNETIANDLKKLIQSTDERDQLAACLVLYESKYPLCKEIKDSNREIIEKFNAFHWSTLENNEPIYTGN